MADKAISDLSAATSIQSDDNFVLEQNGTAKRLTGQTLINWLTKAADGHGGIKTIEKLSTNGLTDTYQITLADNTTFDFSVTNGRAISSVNQTGTSGLTRTYTISFNNNTTQKFTVTDGRAITSITETSVNGLTRTYTISFNDGESQTFDVTDGRAITDIVETSADGLTRTYTISFNDNTKKMFTVKDGRGITNVSVAAIGTLKKMYTMHFNDGTSTSFTITDGRSISSIEKSNTDQSTDTDTYTIYFNDDTTETFSVKNGAKGDKGDNTYTHIKFASEEPKEDDSSIGDVPDNWIGFYWGTSEEVPDDWRVYKWFEIKGQKGDTGDAASVVNTAVEYQVSDSGTILPSGAWEDYVPVVPQGKYLWTRVSISFNIGDPIVSYSVTRMGLDGAGSVSSVANISPDENGNVPLTPAALGAVSSAGGELTGGLTAPQLAVSQKAGFTQAIRFLNADGSMKLTIYPGSNGNLYIRQIDPVTKNSEYFVLPALTSGLTANGNYKILTSKETVSIENGGTGATDAAQALANLGGISIVKVWANASQNSEFPGQEIAAPWAKDYDLFIVSCRRSPESQTRVSEIVPHTYGVSIIGTFYVDGSNGPSRINSRSVLISRNAEKVTFGDNYRKYANETEPTKLNTALIPVEIYGIKGVTV